MIATWASFVREMRATNKPKEKRLIVQKYKELRPVWELIYDPLKTTGVTATAIHKYRAKSPSKKPRVEVEVHDALKLLSDLTERKLTGHAALHCITMILKRNPEYEAELIDLFSGNPKLGFDVKQINQSLEDLGEKPVCYVFSVALAFEYESKRHVPGDKWYLSRKLDGVRVVVVGGVPMTRNGAVIVALKEAFEKIKVPRDIVLDGEMCIMKDDGVTEDFKEAISQFRQGKKQIENFRFYVFDAITKEAFDKHAGDDVWSERFKRAHRVIQELKDPRLVPVEAELFSTDSLAAWQARQKQGNWEGLMVRRDAPYVAGRTHDLLKMKAFQSFETKVIDITIGTKQILNAYSGVKEDCKIMAAAVIEYKGNHVQVGSGWTDQQRLEFVEHPERIIGSVITVQYFEETQDKKTGKVSLRFPTVQMLWGVDRDM